MARYGVDQTKMTCYNTFAFTLTISRGSSLVERSPEEAGVVSSILTRGTSLRSDLNRNYGRQAILKQEQFAE